MSFEFLAYYFESLANAGYEIELLASSPPPYLNFPGRMLRFALQGWRDAEKPTEPADIAETLVKLADEFCVPAEHAWREDDPLDGRRAQEMHKPDADEPQS